MMVTEEEAKTKRCQESFGPQSITMTQMPSYGVFSGNGVVLASPTHCIGSACMAWRWVRDRGWMENREFGHIGEEHIGYCGKAGRP